MDQCFEMKIYGSSDVSYFCFNEESHTKRVNPGLSVILKILPVVILSEAQIGKL